MSYDPSAADGPKQPALGEDEGSNGELALRLVESLIHSLVATEIISVGDAVDVVDIAIKAYVDVVIDRRGTETVVVGPAAPLKAIGVSLQTDLPEDA